MLGHNKHEAKPNEVHEVRDQNPYRLPSNENEYPKFNPNRKPL